MASPFPTTSDPIPLPFDEGQWVQVRALTGREHEAAQDAHRLAFVASPNNWAGFFRANASDPNSAAVQRILADPLTGYDRYALVRFGLEAWSYAEPIKSAEGEASTEERLDEERLDFIAREVLKRTKPGLFQSPDDREQAEKNATGSSTEV